MVEKALNDNNLETAVHFMSKSIALIKVLDKDGHIKENDMLLFNQLRKSISSSLKDEI